MRKVLLGTALLWALLCAVPLPTMAGTYVNVSIGLPPPMYFARPPELVVLPGSYVYVAPDVAEDIFFYNGWWWRPWRGHWYRSRSCNSGWAYYRNVPSFYRGIHPGWRDDYREHRWQGHPWDHQRIPHQQLQQNWRGWEQNRHWERQQHWGVPGLRSQPQSQQFRPQQSREARSEQPSQYGNRERGQGVQQGRRSGSPQPSQLQTQQSQPQTGEVKQGRSRQQHGRPENGEEEQQRRR